MEFPLIFGETNFVEVPKIHGIYGPQKRVTCGNIDFRIIYTIHMYLNYHCIGFSGLSKKNYKEIKHNYSVVESDIQLYTFITQCAPTPNNIAMLDNFFLDFNVSSVAGPSYTHYIIYMYQ